MIEKVISGGQIGVDQAGLRAAKLCGIPTGGWAPKGYLTANGAKKRLLQGEYGLQETDSSKYLLRTKLNVKDSDATVAIAIDPQSPGTQMTLQFARRMHKPYFLVDLRKKTAQHRIVTDLRNWLDRHNVSVLNVAGNRSEQAGLQAYRILLSVFRSNGIPIPIMEDTENGRTGMEKKMQKKAPQQQRHRANQKGLLSGGSEADLREIGVAV